MIKGVKVAGEVHSLNDEIVRAALEDLKVQLGNGSFIVGLANAVKAGAITLDMLDDGLKLSASVVDDLKTADALKPLSANQGKILKELIDIINGTGEGSTDKKITDAIAKLVDKAPEDLDTLKEFADWIENHGKEVANILVAINSNARAIADEVARATEAEAGLYEAISHVEENVNRTNTDLTETKKNIASSLHASGSTDSVNITGKSDVGRTTFSAKVPSATTESAGVMTADDKKKLDGVELVERISWGIENNLDDYTTEGNYSIAGNNNNGGNIPILNEGIINARLSVLVTENSGNKVVTQVLTLNNNTGGEGNIYIRSNQNGTWKPWGKLQTNVEVGSVETLDNLTDNGIYSGVWTKGSYNSYPLTFVCVAINDYFVGVSPRRISQFVYGLSKFDGSTIYQSRVWDDSKNAWGDWEILNQKEISSMISDEIKKVTDGVDPEKLDSLKDLIAWVDAHGGEVSGIKNDIQANKTAIEKEVKRATEAEGKLEEKIAKEKTALVNGNTIVGLAREVYSRQGKVDTATFLKRTTAGGTSVSDGVATLKQIGGNIVKNLVDTSFVGSETLSVVNGHIYYFSSYLYNGQLHFADTSTDVCGGWKHHGIVLKATSGSVTIAVEGDNALNALLIDLTEMFGAGKDPTKEECDRMFACMGALPQGLTVAQPTGLKSIGYNQWNPDNVLEYKSVSAGSIIGVSGSHIAVIECLPCKTGTGENNGYVIGYGEGDAWSDEGIEVYLTPLNPMEVDGELYLQKLVKDATYGTYVPQIKGYLLVVTPTTDKLCAHFHWSGDRAKTDYEEYIESNVALPVIPEMSEWGLAGIQASGIQDSVNLEKNTYTKRIDCLDLGNINYQYYSPSETYPYGFFATSIKNARFSKTNALMCEKYAHGSFAVDKAIMANTANNGTFYIIDGSYTDAVSLKKALEGIKLYYEITPEEYPIVTKAAPNYIGSDYGVEEFTGSKVPLVANILFYMRSLVSETRNFLDRLMARFGISDATAVADKIADAIIPTTEETDVEPTEVIEE